MRYLGYDAEKLRIAVFDFTSCEGCELQLANKEETLIDFLAAIDIVRFREISSHVADDYDIALIEGAISRGDEFARLIEIRKRAKILVALGSCACFGGVNQLKNAFTVAQVNQIVYEDCPKETLPVHRLSDIVPLDLEIPGCPVDKSEIERIIQHLMWGVPFSFPDYPLCVECKQRFLVCRFDLGELCLGPVTRAGCRAPCPAGGLGCWGCRGPSVDANLPAFIDTLHERGFDQHEIDERFGMFGGFADADR